MNNLRFNVVVVAGLLLVGIGLSAFTVNQRELAIKLQVGEVVREDYEPGLHFKIPVFQTIRKFPKRILTISDRPERIFTAERLALQVDFFVKWRIVDPVQFYTSTGGALLVAPAPVSRRKRASRPFTRTGTTTSAPSRCTAIRCAASGSVNA